MAEVVGEQVVALQAQELTGELTLSPHDLGDRDRGVVVADALGHPAEELEAGQVAGLEGLGALARVTGEEVGVRVGQGDDGQVGLAPLAGDLDGGLAEVDWAWPGGWLSGTNTSFE